MQIWINNINNETLQFNEIITRLNLTANVDKIQLKKFGSAAKRPARSRVIL